MKDFNLHKFLRDNPLTKQALKKGKINEAFEGFGGVKGIGAIGDGVPFQKNAIKEEDPWGWDKHVAQMRDDEQDRPNKWIMDIDRMPAVNGWKASWEHPGIISWTHPEVHTAMVVATPSWDGPGTPVEFQSEAGASQMLKVLDQDKFSSFKDYAVAVKPYLDMVLDANVNPASTDYETSDIKAPGMEEEGHMGTQYDSSEDMAVDMVKKGIREGGINTPRVDYLNPMEDEDDLEMPSRIEGLVDQRELAKFAEAVMAIAQDLDNEGFDAVDIKKLLKDKLDDMIIS